MGRQTDWSRQAEALTARRSELQERLGRLEHDLDEPKSKDDEDRAVERETDEVLEDLGVAGLREIGAIDKALERIEAGTYGICQRCGEEISPERLAAVPTTGVCRNCA